MNVVERSSFVSTMFDILFTRAGLHLCNMTPQAWLSSQNPLQGHHLLSNPHPPKMLRLLSSPVSRMKMHTVPEGR